MTVLAEVVRSGVVECVHHGSFVVLDERGEVLAAAGEPQHAILPRSSNKPLQLLGMLRCGLELPAPLLAVAGASHAGEPMHVARVERILTVAGLDAGALACPGALPGDPEAAAAAIRAGEGAQPRFMNCSGKHAAMLATCVHNGWPTGGYLDPGHPLQQALAATVAELTGEPIGTVAVDGCGAPIFPASLTGLARAFRQMAAAAEGSHERRVVDAFRAHPLLVAGTRRDDGRLAASLPTLFAKAGAEGVYAGALGDGQRAFAIRTHDGAARSTMTVVAELLDALGERSAVVDELRRAPVSGGGRTVGEVRPGAEVAAIFARLPELPGTSPG